MAEQSGITQGTGGGTTKVLIVAVVLVAVVAVFYAKGRRPASNPTAGPAERETGAASAHLPRLVDLGADKCIPCKLMAPILDEMKTAYAGRLVVEFIDVWKNPDAGKKHGVEIIPTQIFFGPSGKELFRHQGFFSKDDILAKWKELGFDLNVTPGSTPVRESPLIPDKAK